MLWCEKPVSIHFIDKPWFFLLFQFVAFQNYTVCITIKSHVYYISKKYGCKPFFVIPIKKQARFGADGSINIHLFAIIRLKIGFKLLNFIGRGFAPIFASHFAPQFFILHFSYHCSFCFVFPLNFWTTKSRVALAFNTFCGWR